MIANLKEEEAAYSAKGKYRFSKKIDPCAKLSLEILQTRSQKGDLRKAEALARVAADELQLLKSLLSRGLLVEARALLDQIRGPDLGQFIQNEILIQEARYSYLTGDWQDSVQKCNLLESCAVVFPIDKMTLYQIRANAYFELSDFSRSEMDLQKLKGFETLFPSGQIPLYAHTNRLRILSRKLGTEYSAQEEEQLWKNWVRSLPNENLDPLLTLLRARIERLRLEKTNYATESRAAWLVSNALGDDLYSGLACLDLYTSLYPATAGSILDKELSNYEAAHPRIRKLKEEVFFGSGEQGCETARTIRSYIAEKKLLSAPIAFEIGEIKSLILLRLGVFVDLQKKKISKIDLQPQSKQILQQLSKGPLEKEILFQEVWQIKNFSREKHDSVIRTALHRIRVQAGIEISCSYRDVILDPATLILEI